MQLDSARVSTVFEVFEQAWGRFHVTNQHIDQFKANRSSFPIFFGLKALLFFHCSSALHSYPRGHPLMRGGPEGLSALRDWFNRTLDQSERAAVLTVTDNAAASQLRAMQELLSSAPNAGCLLLFSKRRAAQHRGTESYGEWASLGGELPHWGSEMHPFWDGRHTHRRFTGHVQCMHKLMHR